MDYENFKKEYGIELNEQQDSAVCRVNGQTLLLAVPGSGKTTVITARVGYMIFCGNIPPENILTVTYSVAAARDMKARFENVFGEDIKTQFRTIHGLCALIIRAYERLNDTKAFSLLERDSKVYEIIRNLYVELAGEYPPDGMVKDIRTQITYAGNMLLDESELPDIDFGNVKFKEIFKKYKLYKLQNKVMDYDDQLLFALKILKSYPSILRSARQRYKYVNVDEAQDTSRIQHEIIRLIVGKSGNIFMVGDEDQSIYSFRAAYPKALTEFKKTYPEAEIMFLEKNYRSTGAITEHACNFIRRNKERYDKKMTAHREQGEIPVLTMPGDIAEQYSYIAGKARECGETAVLYRSTESVIPLVDLLEKQKIPYFIRENDCAFFSHPIVTDIVNLLTLSQDPQNKEAFIKVYYKLGCAVTKEKALRAYKSDFPLAYLIEKESDDQKNKKLISLKGSLDRAGKLESFFAIKYILMRTGYGRYVASRYKNETKTRILLALARQNPDISVFLERLNCLKGIIEKGSEQKSGLILSTVHASKGLEYDNVIIMDVVAGIFPPKDCDAETLEEERRIFYVAATRAKNNLEIITSAKEHGCALSGECFAAEYFVHEENATVAAAVMNSKFRAGTEVRHKVFGKGMIMSVSGDFADIKFANGMNKKLDMVFCINNGFILNM